MNSADNPNSIFPRGEKAPSDYFTGTAWLNILVQKNQPGNYTISNVEFEPGCRNYWHTHPAGQILLITDGKGYYQERGKTARLLGKGDVVVIPSNLEHWHGATKDNNFTHLTITNVTEEGAVKWLTPVTDEEYNSVNL